MNSLLRMEFASGITPFSRLAPASLKETSLTLSEKVENGFSRVWISGCGAGAGVAGLRCAASTSGFFTSRNADSFSHSLCLLISDNGLRSRNQQTERVRERIGISR